MNITYIAKQFAHEAHDAIEQKRKYSGDPYWVHTDAVANLVTEATARLVPYSVERADNMIAAASLHDTLEDTPTTFNELVTRFGIHAASLVVELTDVYTKANFPRLNRAERKRLENTRLATISNDAKTIKLADITDNTNSIFRDDPDFSRVYIPEMVELLPLLRGGDETLYYHLDIQLKNCLNGLVK